MVRLFNWHSIFSQGPQKTVDQAATSDLDIINVKLGKFYNNFGEFFKISDVFYKISDEFYKMSDKFYKISHEFYKTASHLEIPNSDQ